MRTAKRLGMPRDPRKAAIVPVPVPEPARACHYPSVLVRTVAFLPAWQRRRAH